MAFLKINMLYTAIIIAGTTLFISMVGFRLGKFFGYSFGKKAEFAGGLILIAIGTKILIEHLQN
jgi:putative Mn2+ efflux pump MntP